MFELLAQGFGFSFSAFGVSEKLFLTRFEVDDFFKSAFEEELGFFICRHGVS